MFLFALVLIWWAYRSRLLSEWDEFSHWGLAVKSMFTFNSLPRGSFAHIFYAGYPPATTLFHYFFAKLYGGFEEGNIFRSMNLLSFSLLLPIFARFSFKNVKNIIIALALAVFTPLFFAPLYYTTIYVDSFLGVLFAFAIYSYYAKATSPLARCVSICLSLFVLSISKASGFGLAMIACLIFAVSHLLQIAKAERFKLKSFLIPISYFASGLLGFLSWKLYCFATHTASDDVYKLFSLSSIFKLLSGTEEEYRYTVIQKFFKALFSSDFKLFPFALTILPIALIFAIAMYSIYKQAQNKKLTQYAFIGIGIGGGLYILSVLFAFLYAFSPYEAVNLSSSSRYLSTYCTAAALSVVYIYTNTMPIFSKSNAKQLLPHVLICALIVFAAPSANLLNITFNAPKSVHATEDLRGKSLKLAAQASRLDYTGDKLYYIEQNSSGFGRIQARYTAYPTFVDGGSIGTPYGDGDVWTQSMTCEQWQEMLVAQSFTYVYINSCDEQFIAQFGNAFESKSDINSETMYKINITNGKAMLSKAN